MKKIHLLPNFITAFGLSCGLFVIFKINMTALGEVTPELLVQLAGLLLLAALADLLDGAVARAIKAESEFGGFFDSIADAISFGVAPSLIVLKSLSIPPGEEHSFLLLTGAMVFTVCGVLRLVRFNVGLLHKETDGDPKAGVQNFTGLPIPAAAAALVSANLFFVSKESRWFFELGDENRAIILFLIMLTLGYFMVSRWKFPSFKRLEFRVASFQVVFLTAITTVFIFYGILNHFPLVFFLFSWIYLLVALVLSTVRLIAGRKSKTLEDFEPEEDEE
jgi:CDP-diacylglycerol--serine O-phosphatidyltransferase